VKSIERLKRALSKQEAKHTKKKKKRKENQPL
jgi:hypothetical protein